ncbi:MAG: hypothetical protein OXU96_06770 [Gammaproteobacteria bacterium]|nr:hypothetical protein [Gammaproteobacteria bacterium]
MKTSPPIAVTAIAFCFATPASASLISKIVLSKIPGRLISFDANFLEGMIGAILGGITGYILGNKIGFKPWALAAIDAVLGAAWLGSV